MHFGGGHLLVLAHFAKEVEFLVLRGVGFLGFGDFEKIKCIFSIAPMGNLEKSRECFLSEKHSPDAECEGTGRWPQSLMCLTLLGLSTGRSLSASGG